jgi:capsular polysaccharide transport system permease protein
MTQLPSDIPFFGSTASQTGLDAELVTEFILSRDMLGRLEDKHNLKSHFQNSEIDLLSRLPADASKEDFLEYYQDHLSVTLNEVSSVLTIEVQAFSAGYSTEVLETVLEESELFINNIGHKLARSQVLFVQGEIERAQQNLRDSKRAILEFQDTHKLYNPEQEGVAMQTVVHQLEGELARSQTELKSLKSFMNAQAPEVVSLRGKIKALEQQLEQERSKLAGNPKGQNLNDITSGFQDLKMDIEFATDIYKTALITLEQARVEAYRKLKHLVIVESPELPEDAKYPRIIYNIATLGLILLLVYGVFVIVIATIREHKDM